MAATKKTEATKVTMTPERAELAELQRKISRMEKTVAGTPESFKARRKLETAGDLALAQAELRTAVKAYNDAKAANNDDSRVAELLAAMRQATAKHLDVLSAGSEWEQKKLRRELDQLNRQALVLRRKVNAKPGKK